MWWFVIPLIVSVGVIAGAIALGCGPVLAAWPFFAAAIVCGLLAWRLYAADGAERSGVFATVA
jgi:hypothetical protein